VFFFTRADYKESKGLRTPLRPFSDLSERRSKLRRLSRSAPRALFRAIGVCKPACETNNALLPLRGVPCSIDSDACNRYVHVSASYRDWNRRGYLAIYFIPGSMENENRVEYHERGAKIQSPIARARCRKQTLSENRTFLSISIRFARATCFLKKSAGQATCAE